MAYGIRQTYSSLGINLSTLLKGKCRIRNATLYLFLNNCRVKVTEPRFQAHNWSVLIHPHLSDVSAACCITPPSNYDAADYLYIVFTIAGKSLSLNASRSM